MSGDEEYVHHRDWAMVAPWAMCSIPMPANPPAPGARECPDCKAAMDSMCRETQQHD